MRRSLTEKMQEYGFASIEHLNEIRDLIKRQPEIQKQYFELQHRLDNLNSKLTSVSQQLAQALEQVDDNSSLTEIAAMLKLLSEKSEIADAEVYTLQNKLEKQQKYQRSYESFASQLQAVEQQLAVVTAELAELSETQPESRQKLRQLLVNQLLTKANQVLEKINGRYYLRSAESEYGLALEIEDSRQKNLRRLPKTLSGGESFTVSLALALALADVANNGKAIESLFLDEGFGNLDAEALYQAMTTLESLKLQGKTVGIISHVDAVKKRIKTQISLVKNAQGYSELVVG